MILDELAIVFPKILLSDFLRYFLVAAPAFLIFWVFGKKYFSHLFIQKKYPHNRRLWYEFRYSMSTVMIFALNGLGIYTAKVHGLTQIYLDVSQLGWIYLPVSFLLMLLFHDTYFYWTHRWMHLPGIYRHVHKVHHMSTNPSPWAAYSFHPFEAVIQALSFTIMVFLIPLHPAVMFLFLGYMIVRDVLGHLGYEIFPKGFTGNPWFNWHTTSTHHNLHHSRFNYNYGFYFTWWDNLMKTTHPQYQEIYQEVKERSGANELD